MTDDTPRWAERYPELTGGSPAAFDFAVETVELHGGSQIRLASPGVTAIVGGNNVGKSTVLRNIKERLEMPGGNQAPSGFQLVSALSVAKKGSDKDITAWLAERAEYVETPQSHGFATGAGNVHNLGDMMAYWRGVGQAISTLLSPFILYFADARERLNFQHEVQQREDVSNPPVHPIHYLQDDPALLEAVSRRSQDVFRQPLTLDRLGLNARLRVGIPSVDAPPVDAVTAEYRTALKDLVPVAQQGDGMRSFLSLLLPLITGTSKVVIIDEPEAFLHPPQAYALGRAVAELARDKHLQVVLATHDKNLLSGLLEPSDVDVSVVRLTRAVSANATAHQLENAQLRSIWTDPALRYTNVLDGLFHRMVVLCEAERDCHFYAAALDAANAAAETAVPPSEVLFVPSGGKDGMVKLVRTLRQVHVPVAPSPDLDILDDEAKIRGLVVEMGGDWATLASDYRIATEAFRKPRERIKASDVLIAVTAVLEPQKDAPFTEDIRERVLVQTRSGESRWKALKREGEDSFKGQAAEAAERLLSALDQLGIVTVRPGELERMAPKLGVGKGPAWLPAALAADAHNGSLAQSHVGRLLAVAVTGALRFSTPGARDSDDPEREDGET